MKLHQFTAASFETMSFLANEEVWEEGKESHGTSSLSWPQVNSAPNFLTWYKSYTFPIPLNLAEIFKRNRRKEGRKEVGKEERWEGTKKKETICVDQDISCQKSSVRKGSQTWKCMTYLEFFKVFS